MLRSYTLKPIPTIAIAGLLLRNLSKVTIMDNIYIYTYIYIDMSIPDNRVSPNKFLNSDPDKSEH